MAQVGENGRRSTFRGRLRRIIFGVNTPAGKAFDVALLWAILLSVVVVFLESVPDIRGRHGTLLRVAEWFFTVIFTVEYGVRLWTVHDKRSYALSFFGIIDLVAIVPTYASAMFTGSQSLATVRAIRLLRVFRVLKLVRHVKEAHGLVMALRSSRPKIVVFTMGVLSCAVIFGTVMYLVEGDAAGFTSIPTSIYWAVVTMTTVGYGDIAPQTALGQLLALILMVLGYGIIAVPTGIFSAELTRSMNRPAAVRRCDECGSTRHVPGANFCGTCGEELDA